MAATLPKPTKMRRSESRKSHSWWWNSHISPKKSKWLQENLEEMDGYVKRMLKLIEEDADSFAKKAEMYYKKRPELVNLVEEFYRMYRALAERYDLVTGELRKRVPLDLQSQGSGISDTSSEQASTYPSPDQHIERRGSGPRAAGFDIFLGGIGKKSEQSNKEGDESSTTDSGWESDDSSIINYVAMPSNDEEQALRKKISELEAEISKVKEKHQLLEEGIIKGSYEEPKSENYEALLARLAEDEVQLNAAREKIKLSEDEVNKLKDELQKSLEYSNIMHGDTGVKQGDSDHLEVLVGTEHLVCILEEELKTTKEKLLASETEVENLRQELQNSKSSAHLENKYDSELSDRDQEIERLREAISNANKTLSEEKSRLQTDIGQLLKEKICLEDNLKEMDSRCQSLQEDISRIKAEKEEIRTLLEAEIEKLEAGINEKNNSIENLKRNLEAFILRYDTLLAEKKAVDSKITDYIAEIGAKNIRIDEMDKHLHQLHLAHVELIVAAEGARKQAEELKSRVGELEQEVERQREVVMQGAEEKREAIRQLCFSLEHYRNGYHMLRQAVIGHKRLVMAS